QRCQHVGKTISCSYHVLHCSLHCTGYGLHASNARQFLVPTIMWRSLSGQDDTARPHRRAWSIVDSESDLRHPIPRSAVGGAAEPSYRRAEAPADRQVGTWHLALTDRKCRIPHELHDHHPSANRRGWHLAFSPS